MRQIRRRAVLFIGALLVLVSLSACGGSGRRVVFTTGVGKDEVFRVGSAVCTLPEMTVYLANARNQYERVYGPEVWGISKDGATLEGSVKEAALAKIAQIKTMCLLAQDREVALDEAEGRRAQEAAEEYFGSLSGAERELVGDLSVVEGLYREYALAGKVYRHIIQDVNPEISDDEARTITVQHILLGTSRTDGDGRETALSDEEKRQVYEKACEIRVEATEGGQDFVDLATRYSEDPVIRRSFGKGEMDPAFEEAAFSLETGEVSGVVETGEGYHIIKCLSTFDREQTDLNKLAIVEERRREVFGQEYDAFVETLARQLNAELWAGISLPRGIGTGAEDFFEVYERHFPEP